jgi:signal transduction histidine kinase
VQGDPKSLERALTAILDNAIKFSPEGGNVQIQVWSPPVIPGEVHHSEVCISVTDQGVGIPPEALPRVFDRFYRLEEVQGHLFGGVGLGLSIAKQVVENHNGQITAQSTLGEGSTFTIRLKLAM